MVNAYNSGGKTENLMIQPDERPEKTVAPGQPYVVDLFRPEDAEGIVHLFRAVYGDGYPIRLFYDEKALTDANAAGENYSIVARTPSGDVVAVHNLFRSAPYERVYEIGAGLVLKEYRNLGIAKQVMRFIYEQWVRENSGIEETFGEPVCNHTHMQKMVAGFDNVVTAVEVALMPAEAYGKEQSARGRVAALSVFRCYRPKPHRVFLPPVYEQEMRLIYSRLDDTRDICLADSSVPDNLLSRAEMTIFDFARVARIAVHEIGVDFSEHLDDLENRALEQNTVVFQIWLKLSDPWVGAAVDLLRGRGYFFGGALPRWFDDDGMLMQKVLCEPQFEAIQLHTDWARTLSEMVRNDWDRTREAKALPPGA